LAVANRGANKLLVYQQTGDTFTLVATPVAATGSQIISCVAFSPNGNYLVAALSSSSAQTVIFRKVGSAFNKMPALNSVPSAVNGAAFSGDSLTLALAHSATPYVATYRVEYDTNSQFKLPTQTVDGLGLLGYIKT